MSDSRNRAKRIIRKEALTGAVSSLVINASLGAWNLRGKGPHVLSVDSIAAREPTVFSSAVPMALSLGIIAATMAYFSFRKKAAVLDLAPPRLLNRPYFFFGLRQALASAVFMFGAVVAVSVLWQRFFGTVSVETPVAALLSGIVAGLTSYHSTTRTAGALLRED